MISAVRQTCFVSSPSRLCKTSATCCHNDPKPSLLSGIRHVLGGVTAPYCYAGLQLQEENGRPRFGRDSLWSRGRLARHVKHCNGALLSVFFGEGNKVKFILKSLFPLPLCLERKVVKQCVLSVMAYESESWTLTRLPE